MLICDDVAESVRFYTETLGFVVRSYEESIGRSGFATLQNGAAAIMLASPHGVPAATKIEGEHKQSIYYFHPRDVVALHAQLVSRGLEPSALTVRFYGMKEFRLVDPSGHVLVFGQDTDEPPTEAPAEKD